MSTHTTRTETHVHQGTAIFTPKCSCGWTGIGAFTADVAQDDSVKHAAAETRKTPADTA